MEEDHKGINRYFQFLSQSLTRREEIVADAEREAEL
jgi:hypothetical protein